MTDTERKDKINEMTRRMSLSDAKVVYVRHVNEEVSLDGHSPWGGICHLIHPDVTLKEFFRF